MPQFVKHETVADRTIVSQPITREDGSIYISNRYGEKTIKLQGTIVAADQATLDANIDLFKELFSRVQKNLDVSWGGGTTRFVATCKSHTFDRDHYNLSACPWTAEFTVLDGVGKDTASTTAASAVAVDTTNPTVTRRSTGATSAADTLSHAITMPTGIVAGEILVLIFTSDGNPTCTAPADWTKLGQTTDGTNAVTQAIFWKTAAGSDTCTITTSASEQSTHVVLGLANAGTPSGTATSGNSTDSNPPTHAPIQFISDRYLWIATRGGDAQVAATVAPAAYSQLQTSTAAGANGASTNTAERLLNINPAFSEDPGTFTAATEQWVAYTISVPPRNHFAYESDQQFTLAGSAIPKPVVTLTLTGTPDAAMRGIQYTNTDTGERMIIPINTDMSGLSGKQIVIDFSAKTVTDNLAGTAFVERKFYGVFPKFKIGANNVRIQTGGFINQATSDYQETIPSVTAFGGANNMISTWWAQSFSVPNTEDSFAGFVLGLMKVGTPGAFTWYIKNDNAGAVDWGGATIASGTIGPTGVSSTSNMAYIYVPASAIFSLTANTKYWLAFTAAASDASNAYYIYGTAGSLYSAPYDYIRYGDTSPNFINSATGLNFHFRLVFGGSPKATTFTHNVAYNKTYL